jgi:hypothetical protein
MKYFFHLFQEPRLLTSGYFGLEIACKERGSDDFKRGGTLKHELELSCKADCATSSYKIQKGAENWLFYEEMDREVVGILTLEGPVWWKAEDNDEECLP